MRIWVNRGLKILGLLLVLAAAIGIWKREEITRLMAVNSLFAPDKIVHNFSNMNSMFLSAPLPRGDGPAASLPAGAAMALPAGFDDWAAQRSVTAVVVLQNGMLRHESYYQGTGAEDLRISWSVAKSVLSLLMGIALDQGAIASLDDPVTTYAPQLVGSAYDGATIRNVLNMASGVAFNEDYFDFNSDINKMGRVLALGGSLDDFAAGQKTRLADPGTLWHYVSIDTHVLGMVIRGATGRDIPDLLTEQILGPIGIEADGYYVTDGLGASFVLGGLNLRTRDYARIGQLIAQRGVWNGRQIVPAPWVDAAIAPSAPPADALGTWRYGYQFWIPEGAAVGEVMARGVYGQYLWIDTARGIVIAVNSADIGFNDDGVDAQNAAMFRAMAGGL